MRGRLHRTRSSGAAKGASAPQLARRFHTASVKSRNTCGSKSSRVCFRKEAWLRPARTECPTQATTRRGCPMAGAIHREPASQPWLRLEVQARP